MSDCLVKANGEQLAAKVVVSFGASFGVSG